MWWQFMSWENSSESSVYLPILFSIMAFTANIIFSLFSLAKSMDSCIQFRYCFPSLVSTGRKASLYSSGTELNHVWFSCLAL